MGNTITSFVSFFRSLSYQKKFTIVTASVLVIMLPAVLLVISQQQNINSKADTATLIEAESGTISGKAVIKSSSLASGGKYILFGGSSSTQTPTPTTFQAPTPTPTKWPPTPTPHPTIKPISTPTLNPHPTNRPIATPTPPPGHGNNNQNRQN